MPHFSDHVEFVFLFLKSFVLLNGDVLPNMQELTLEYAVPPPVEYQTLIDAVPSPRAGGCQVGDGPGYVPSDRSLTPQQTWRDDWCALHSGVVSWLSWKSCFFNQNTLTACDDDKSRPPDSYLVRLFEDNGGIPGIEILPSQNVIITASEDLPLQNPCRRFEATLPVGFTVQSGQCYWIEISGFGDAAGGCTVYLARADNGNGFAVSCQDDQCSVVVAEGRSAPDIELCIEHGLSVPPQPAAACCGFDGSCVDSPYDQCPLEEGVWWVGDRCEDDPCPEVCHYANCRSAFDLNSRASGSAASCTDGLPCGVDLQNWLCPPGDDSIECTLDTLGTQAVTVMGAELWLRYRTAATECGSATASLCGATDWDSVLAVYDGGSDGFCPSDLADSIGCGDDTCASGSPASLVQWEAEADRTYFIRVGGWQGDRGQGLLELSLERSEACGAGKLPLAPLANDQFDAIGTVRPCTTDKDCTAGLPGPQPQSFCRPGLNGTSCYVPRQRYLSIVPSPELEIPYAIRVQLDGDDAEQFLGYASPPVLMPSAGPGPRNYWVSRLQDEPNFQNWSVLGHEPIYIGDCQISPGNQYEIQTLPLGEDPFNESSYSSPLLLRTSGKHGDVTGGGEIGYPPDGTANLVDVFAIVLGFQNLQHEPKDWLDLEPNTGAARPNLVVSLADAFAGVQAFQQQPYPGPHPTECP